jgi:hypothetical protein
MQFSNLWCSSTQGGLPMWRGWVESQNYIKPWNFEDQIDILSVGIVNFQYS